MSNKGICVLRCQKGNVHGVVYLSEILPQRGVHFQVKIIGISPGLHGFHIHKTGNTLDGAHTLCEHYNPTRQNHGGLNSKYSHLGDLGNLKANSKGDVQQTINSRLLSLEEIFGRSLIVHADRDDLGKGNHKDSLTTGHSGKRILWGIIARDGECE